MLFPVVLKMISRGLEMYFHTSFQIACYNFVQDHIKEHGFKLGLKLCTAEIPSTQ